MNHLERITQAMDLPEDHFYILYVDECFFFSSPTWRRLRPFLVRSAELGRLDCVERVVQNLLENLVYAPMLFEVAEGLFREGLWEAAELLYKNVSASEKYQNSERLALCQYRLFLIAIGDDQARNLQAAHLFEGYLDRLDEADQLDGLNHLGHVYGSMNRWHKVDELANKMLQLATIRYNLQWQSNRRESNEKKTEKPLYFYILYAQLIRSTVCEELGDFNSALDWVSLYMDGSWIQEDNEEVKRTVAQFQEWGTANRLLYRVMAGQYEALSEYVEYISHRPDEIFIALYNIILSANRYDWNVDNILERFASYIPYRTYATAFGDYNRQLMLDQHTQFLAELATYYLHDNRKEGIRLILQSLESSARINNESNVIKCVDLFGQHRNQANEEENEQYKVQIGAYL
ncbi:hypothetical protein C162_21458 [Paenibacillus sp. FSL R7-269]|nr:hypothetical protein C162_21458 [Paenibacillus sp. FSL R7-269]